MRRIQNWPSAIPVQQLPVGPPGADHENNQVGQWKITQATMYPGGFTSSPLADPYYWLFLNFFPWLLKNSKLHS